MQYFNLYKNYWYGKWDFIIIGMQEDSIVSIDWLEKDGIKEINK